MHAPALASYVTFLVALLFTTSLIRVNLPGVLSFASNIDVTDLMLFTNKERALQGLSALTENQKLNAAALAKAQYMFKNNFWAHTAPDGTTPWYFFTQAGYDYRYAGENLARDFNDSASVVAAWMNSPSHRENLLGQNYSDIGFAVLNGTLDGYETTLVVQHFGRPLNTPYVAQTTPEAEKTEVKSAETPASKLNVEPLVTVVPAPIGQVLPAVNVASASRAVTVSLGLFLILLFATDAYISWRRQMLRVSGNTLAHLALLVLAMIGIWYTNGGIII